MSNIKTCYIDDSIDNGLSLYLRNYDGINNKDFVPNKDDTVSTLINKIIEERFEIVIIDSDLANENNLSTATGQQIELVLGQKYPFVFVIVITSHTEDKYHNYIKKFNSREARRTGETEDNYYNRTIKPILDFALIKNKRNHESIETELTEDKGFDFAEKTQIIDSVNNRERITMTKDNLDRIFELFDDIKKNIDEGK